MQNIVCLGKLVQETETIFGEHTWFYRDFFLNFDAITQIYDKIKEKLSTIQSRLIDFNKKKAINQKKSLLKIEAINEIITPAEFSLTKSFEAKMCIKMMEVDERLNEQVKISIFKSIHFSFFDSFREASPILLENQELTPGHTHKLDASLKKEPAYVKIKQAEEDDDIARIMNSKKEKNGTKQLKYKPNYISTEKRDKGCSSNNDKTPSITPHINACSQTNKKTSSIQNKAASKPKQTESTHIPLTIILEKNEKSLKKIMRKLINELITEETITIREAYWIECKEKEEQELRQKKEEEAKHLENTMQQLVSELITEETTAISQIYWEEYKDKRTHKFQQKKEEKAYHKRRKKISPILNAIINTIEERIYVQSEITSILNEIIDDIYIKEEFLQREQVSFTLDQIITKVEKRSITEDEINHILNNVFKQIKRKAQNAEYNSVIKLLSTHFKSVNNYTINSNFNSNASISIQFYERVEQKNYSSLIEQAEAMESSFRAGQIENNLSFGCTEDEANMVVYSDNTYFTAYRYARSWLKPYLITLTTQPTTKFPLGTLEKQHYKILMTGFINAITQLYSFSQREQITYQHVYEHILQFYPNALVKHSARKKTSKDDIQIINISKNTQNPTSTAPLAHLFVSKKALANFVDAIQSMRFFTAAHMFVSQLIPNNEQPFSYTILPERDWSYLFLQIELFINRTSPIYEKIENLSVNKPQVFHEAYKRFLKTAQEYENLKMRHEIKNHSKTWHKHLSYITNEEQATLAHRVDPSFKIFNEFLLYFLNTPDKNMWDEKDYYSDLNNLEYAYNSALTEYNQMLLHLQTISDFHQALSEIHIQKFTLQQYLLNAQEQQLHSELSYQQLTVESPATKALSAGASPWSPLGQQQKSLATYHSLAQQL
jgi:hypothetical protein